MGVDWDLHLLSPLHDVFGDQHEYRPRNGTSFLINGIFDRGYAQIMENLDGDSAINTTSPVLGVRDAEFADSGRPHQWSRIACLSKPWAGSPSISCSWWRTSNRTAMAAQNLFSTW